MLTFECPYLQHHVECSEERERHIAQRHPEFGARLRGLIGGVLVDPDEIRRSTLVGSARLFSKWYADVRGGKHVVVVVVSHSGPERHWIVTAYVARKLVEGAVEWKRT